VEVEEGFVAGDDLGHAGFDGGEVGFGEGSGAIDVVEEAGVGGGAVAEFGLGEELEEGGGHDVGGGVAQNFEGGFVGLLEQPEGDVFFKWGGEIDDARAVFGGGGVHGLFGGFRLGRVYGCGRCERADAGYDHGGGEARGDGGGDVEGGGSAGDFAQGPVGKLDSDRRCAHALQDTASIRAQGWL